MLQKLKSIIKKPLRQLVKIIDKKPTQSFFALMGILLIIIVIGSFVRKPKSESDKIVPPAKAVTIYRMGEDPMVEVQARVVKSGVVKIVAQTSGILQKIYKTEGDKIYKNSQLAWISTNYQGGTAASVGRQIAQKTFEFSNTNYDTQKDLLNKRREIAKKADAQAGDLRDIASQSLTDTRNLISLNENIYSTLDTQLAQLEATNVGGANDSLILQVKQGKAGVLSGLVTLRSALRNSEYQSNNDNEPAKMSALQKELVLEQLDLEERSLDLNKEISQLNLRVSQITESLSYPVSPITGIVERVFVTEGQNINSGTTIAVITGDSNHVEATVLVPEAIAKKLSKLQKAKVHLSSSVIELEPAYVSSEPTDGSLYSITFVLPTESSDQVGNNSSLAIELPLVANVDTTQIFVPLDAVYQTDKEAYVFIASQSAEFVYTAQSLPVVLGNVYGGFVQVISGLDPKDLVILDRTIVAGDLLSF